MHVYSEAVLSFVGLSLQVLTSGILGLSQKWDFVGGKSKTASAESPG